jgi:ABC-type amino acid transport substrate-binding protein
MRRRASLIVLAAFASTLLATDLAACGDKFLVAGRGTRFQRGSAHPVAVVVYAPASSSLASARFGKTSVDTVLSRGGYHPATAASPEQLAEALRSGKADIVVADASDARAVADAAPPGSPRPTIVPVLGNATREQVVEARREWGVALRAPASGDALLDAVDEAAELRAKARKSAP